MGKKNYNFTLFCFAGTQADIYLTSTTPDRLKFSFVAPAPTACNLLVVYYSLPNRIDVYVDGVFKMPTNGDYDKFGKYKLVNEKPKEEYIPSCATSENGDNYIDRENKEVYLVLKGSSKAVLHRSPQLMVSFFLPAMTPEEFFGEKLIENLAAILNIPQDRVRIVDVVSANEGRRKRATGTEVTAEIGPEPTRGKAEPHRRKTCFRGFRSGCIKTSLLSYRDWLE